MSTRGFGRLGTSETEINLSNVSPTSVGGTSFPIVVFGGAPPVSSTPGVASKSKGKKRVAPTPTDVPVGGRWSDAAIANIIDLYEEEWRRCNQGSLAKKHWTHIGTEHERQMPNELRRLEAHIKDKIEKLKAEYRRQKTLPEEQTGGTGSTWPWFDRMRTIMGGSAKGDGLEGGMDQGRSTWQEDTGTNERVQETQRDRLPSSPPIAVDEDDGDVGDPEHVTPPPGIAHDSQGSVGGEGSVPVGDSPRTASCKKPGVSGKANARKRSLTDTVYLANAIASFAEGSNRVEEHKAATSREMTVLLINSNEAINNSNNDTQYKIAQLEMEARRDASAAQERIAAMFASILANKFPPS